MGNCQGFCVSNANVSQENSGEATSNKRHGVTTEKVQSALRDKEQMFGNVGGTTFYEDGVIASDQQQSRNKAMQMRKLGSNPTGASGYNYVGGEGATIT